MYDQNIFKIDLPQNSKTYLAPGLFYLQKDVKEKTVFINLLRNQFVFFPN